MTGKVFELGPTPMVQLIREEEQGTKKKKGETNQKQKKKVPETRIDRVTFRSSVFWVSLEVCKEILLEEFYGVAEDTSSRT